MAKMNSNLKKAQRIELMRCLLLIRDLVRAFVDDPELKNFLVDLVHSALLIASKNRGKKDELH